MRKEQFVSKLMCKAFCSQKLRCRKDLKLFLKLKEVLVTAKVSLVPLKSMPLLPCYRHASVKRKKPFLGFLIYKLMSLASCGNKIVKGNFDMK